MNHTKSFKKQQQQPAKRCRQDWSQRIQLPSFLDASASVSATTFGARRLPEIKSLWRATLSSLSSEQHHGAAAAAAAAAAGLKSGGGKTATRHLRRRTTSHQPRRRHRFPQGNDDVVTKETTQTTKKIPCRRARRKPKLLDENHQVWANSATQSVADHFDSSIHRWMPTHQWHTKRFHMGTLFGWKVALQHTNRGSRAIVRMIQEGYSTIQDVTWRNSCLVVGCKERSTLIQSLQRVCPSFTTGDPNNSCTGASFGEGMMHQIDSFPNDAIGPIKWWISRIPLDGAVQAKDHWWVHLFIHPCILPIVEKLMEGLSKNEDWVLVRQMRIATLQLRGKQSTSQLLTVLNSNNTTNNADGIDQELPHLAAIINDGQDDFVKSYKIQLEKPTYQALKVDTTLVVRQNDRDDADGVIGWDILCLPTMAKDLFIALNSTQGTARAIGLIEESHLYLEADPPVPIFPRDFPDTPSGKQYWNPGDNHDMIRLRQALENGWGRLEPKETNAVIHWESLVDNDEKCIVVVRGNFGQPFLDIVQHGTSSHSICQESPVRRTRRKIRPPGSLIVAPPLSQEASKDHVEACRSLLESLSLPAMIRCLLFVDGRGTIDAGDSLLLTIANNVVILGFVTTGGFSRKRGACRGTGFISAARLLAYLHDNTIPDYVIDSLTQSSGIRVTYNGKDGNTKGMVVLFPIF